MRTTLLTIIMMLVTANGFSLHPRPDLLVSISPSYHHNSSSKVRFRLMRLTLNATNQNDAIGARERMKQARLDYEASCLIREEEAAEVDDDLEALEAREVKKAFKGSSVERNVSLSVLLSLISYTCIVKLQAFFYESYKIYAFELL